MHKRRFLTFEPIVTLEFSKHGLKRKPPRRRSGPIGTHRRGLTRRRPKPRGRGRKSGGRKGFIKRLKSKKKKHPLTIRRTWTKRPKSGRTSIMIVSPRRRRSLWLLARRESGSKTTKSPVRSQRERAILVFARRKGHMAARGRTVVGRALVRARPSRR
jgi:hypothetical protein